MICLFSPQCSQASLKTEYREILNRLTQDRRERCRCAITVCAIFSSSIISAAVSQEFRISRHRQLLGCRKAGFRRKYLPLLFQNKLSREKKVCFRASSTSHSSICANFPTECVHLSSRQCGTSKSYLEDTNHGEANWTICCQVHGRDYDCSLAQKNAHSAVRQALCFPLHRNGMHCITNGAFWENWTHRHKSSGDVDRMWIQTWTRLNKTTLKSNLWAGYFTRFHSNVTNGERRNDGKITACHHTS